MRRRISLTMAAMVVGALVLVGVATLGLTQLDSVHRTQTQLVSEATGLANGVEAELSTGGRHHDLLAVLQNTVSVLKGPLKQQGELLAVSPAGSFYNPLDPRQRVGLISGVKPAQILTDAFFGAEPVSGHRGRLVWAAVLVSTPVPVGNGAQLNAVILLTREAPSGLGTAGTWFALASAATVVVALLAADRLGRRIARPLQQTQAVTGRIAAGDLDARVRLRDREGHELVSLANSVNSMAASLARAQRTQRQFLMSVSHDLRTPLTSIRGFAEALSDGTTNDVHYAAGIILSEARRLERLVADLLELAKLDAGSFSLDCTAVDLSEVVTEAAQSFEPSATALGLSLELTTGEPGAVLCDADPDRLGQVVCNVVENALKYATSRVRVTTGFAGGQPVLTVEDDGPGIAKEDLDRVFERLYQSVSAASRKLGSGLGLAIVDELVVAMGGKVRAESPISATGGTRMVVSLRRAFRGLPAPEVRAGGDGGPRAPRPWPAPPAPPAPATAPSNSG